MKPPGSSLLAAVNAAELRLAATSPPPERKVLFAILVEEASEKGRVTAGGVWNVKMEISPATTNLMIKHGALHFNGNTCGCERPDKVLL